MSWYDCVCLQEFLEKNHPLSMVIRAHECVMVGSSMNTVWSMDDMMVHSAFFLHFSNRSGWFRALCQRQTHYSLQCHGALHNKISEKKETNMYSTCIFQLIIVSLNLTRITCFQDYCGHHKNAGALLFVRRDLTIVPKLETQKWKKSEDAQSREVTLRGWFIQSNAWRPCGIRM